MHLEDMLLESAAKEFQFFKNVRFFPQESAVITLLGKTYGKNVVVSDFELWAEEIRGQELDNPVREYLKKAPQRLQQVKATTERENDPRIAEISSFIFLLINRTPHQDDVKKLLTQYTQEEIQEAFKCYVEPLDEFEQKQAIRNFFRGGGADGIILARKKQKEAMEKQVQIEAASLLAAIQQAEKDREERSCSVREEENAGNPFGDGQ